MKELIPIQEHDGKKAVDARLLHEFLGSKRNFSDWIKDRIKKYGFIENQDYVSFSQNCDNGGRTIEYALSLDCAKELSMVEGNAKGKEARQYFIERDKQLKEIEKPMSELEILQKNVTILIEQDKKLKEHDNRILLLEAKAATRPSYFTIAGYATLRKIKVSLSIAAKFGRKASDICRVKGYPIDKCNDPRFGEVNMHPEDVLLTVFDSPIN